MESADPRKELIERASRMFGKRLQRKENSSVTTFYLDEIKRGNGLLWVYKRMSTKGYRVQFQKVTRTWEIVRKKGYGGYPMRYLRTTREVPMFLDIISQTIAYFNSRYKVRRRTHQKTKLPAFFSDTR